MAEDAARSRHPALNSPPSYRGQELLWSRLWCSLTWIRKNKWPVKMVVNVTMNFSGDNRRVCYNHWWGCGAKHRRGCWFYNLKILSRI
jgi:hypothetical protein